MKKAFFVIGPESSGTRMMTKAFLSLGMFGDGTHGQRLDDMVKNNEEINHPVIAFRRSVPHGNKMPPISQFISNLTKQGYEVYPIIILRDKDMCAESQVSRGHAKTNGKAKQSIKAAIDHIYKELALSNKSPHVVFYEPFVKFKKVRTAFFRQFDLDHPPPEMEFKNANVKYK